MDLSRGCGEIQRRIATIDDRLKALEAQEAGLREELVEIERSRADLQRMRTELTEIAALARAQSFTLPVNITEPA